MGAATALGEFLGASDAGQQALRAGLAQASRDSVGRWRKALGEREIIEVEREIGPLLIQLGYLAGPGSDAPERPLPVR
jgi:hypothetical protein